MAEEEVEKTPEEEVVNGVTPEVEEKPEKEEFEKESETVSANRYNQALRKLKETEAENQRLKGDNKPKEEPKDDVEKIIDEKLKPVQETLKKREEQDRKADQAAFFDAHPKYRDSKEFTSLLDEMDRSINPNSSDDYYTQLEKARRIYEGGKSDDADVEDHKKRVAGDAASGASGAEKTTPKEEFTAEERKYQKDFGISDEGMRAFKKKVEAGDIVFLH